MNWTPISTSPPLRVRVFVWNRHFKSPDLGEFDKHISAKGGGRQGTLYFDPSDVNSGTAIADISHWMAVEEPKS